MIRRPVTVLLRSLAAVTDSGMPTLLATAPELGLFAACMPLTFTISLPFPVKKVSCAKAALNDISTLELADERLRLRQMNRAHPATLITQIFPCFSDSKIACFQLRCARDSAFKMR